MRLKKVEYIKMEIINGNKNNNNSNNFGKKNLIVSTNLKFTFST